MLNDSYWGCRVINGGNWKKVCIFSPMFGSIEHHVGSLLLPNFEESSKDYEPTRLNDPWTFVASGAAAIGDCDGDFCCWRLGLLAVESTSSQSPQ